MNQEEFAELRSRHPYAVALSRDGEIVAAFRNVTFDELKPLYGAGKNPAVVESEIAALCLLWPSLPEFEALRDDQPAIVERAGQAIRSISGGQCVVDHDKDTKTWTASIHPDGGAKLHVITCRKLSWPQYQRIRGELNKDDASQLETYRLACIDGAIEPKEREARKTVFDQLPYLAVTMFGFIYALTGGGEFDVVGNSKGLALTS